MISCFIYSFIYLVKHWWALVSQVGGSVGFFLVLAKISPKRRCFYCRRLFKVCKSTIENVTRISTSCRDPPSLPDTSSYVGPIRSWLKLSLASLPPILIRLGCRPDPYWEAPSFRWSGHLRVGPALVSSGGLDGKSDVYLWLHKPWKYK